MVKADRLCRVASATNGWMFFEQSFRKALSKNQTILSPNKTFDWLKAKKMRLLRNHSSHFPVWQQAARTDRLFVLDNRRDSTQLAACFVFYSMCFFFCLPYVCVNYMFTYIETDCASRVVLKPLHDGVVVVTTATCRPCSQLYSFIVHRCTCVEARRLCCHDASYSSALESLTGWQW